MAEEIGIKISLDSEQAAVSLNKYSKQLQLADKATNNLKKNFNTYVQTALKGQADLVISLNKSINSFSKIGTYVQSSSSSFHSYAVALNSVVVALNAKKNAVKGYSSLMGKATVEIDRSTNSLIKGTTALVGYGTAIKTAKTTLAGYGSLMKGTTVEIDRASSSLVTGTTALRGYGTATKVVEAGLTGYSSLMNKTAISIDRTTASLIKGTTALTGYGTAAKATKACVTGYGSLMNKNAVEIDRTTSSLHNINSALGSYGRSVQKAKADTLGYSTVMGKMATNIDRGTSRLEGVKTSLAGYGRSVNKTKAEISAFAQAQQVVLGFFKKGIGAIASYIRQLTILKVTLGAVSIAASGLTKLFSGLVNTAKGLSSLFLFSKAQSFIQFFSPTKLAEVASEFLGFRNALMLTAKSSDTLSQKIAVSETRLASAAKIARDFKIDLRTTTKEYSKFINAVVLSGTSIQKAESYFKTFAKVARITNMSAQNMSGMFLALEQMVSKGVVSMEELRRQLGQYLPGSMAIAAKAWGDGKMSLSDFYTEVKKGAVESTVFLGKFAKTIEETFGSDVLAQSLQKPQAAMVSLQNSLIALKAALGILIAGPFTAVVESMNTFIRAIGRLVMSSDSLKSTLSTMFQDRTAAESLNVLTTSTEKLNEAFAVTGETVKEVTEPIKKMKTAFFEMTGSNTILMAGIVAGTKVLQLFSKTVLWIVSPFTKLFGWIVKITRVTSYLRVGFLALAAGLGLITAPIAAAGAALAAIATGIYLYTKDTEQAADKTKAFVPSVVETAIAMSEYEAALLTTNDTIEIFAGNQAGLNKELEETPDILTDFEVAVKGMANELSLAQNALEASKGQLEAFAIAGNAEMVQVFSDAIIRQTADVDRLKTAYISILGPFGEYLKKMAEAAATTGISTDQQKVIDGLMEQVKLFPILQEAKRLDIDTTTKQGKAYIALRMAGLKPLSAEYEAMMQTLAEFDKFLEKGKTGTKKLTDAEKDAIAVKKQQKAELKKLQDMREAAWRRQEAWTKSLDKQIKKVKEETNAIGLTGRALAYYNIELKKTTAIETMRERIMADTKTAWGDKEAVIRDNIKAIQDLADTEQNLFELNAIQKHTEEATKAMRELAEEWTSIFDNLGRGIEDVLVDAFSGTLKSFDDFADALKDVFQNLLRDLIRYTLQNPIQIYTTLMGAGGQGLLGGLATLFGGNTSGGGTGIGGMTGGLGGLGSWISSGISGIIEAWTGAVPAATSFTNAAGLVAQAPPVAGVGGMQGLAGMTGPGGTLLSVGAAGALGAAIGSVIGGEKYGGMVGGIGGAAGAFGASSMMGMGALAATGWGAVVAIAASLISKLTEDDNANSKLTMFTGDYGGMFGKSQLSPTGDMLKDGDGARTGIWRDLLFGGIGAKGQHIGNPDDDQISDEEFQKWLDNMGVAFDAMGKLDEAAAEVFNLSEESIAKIKTEVEELQKSTEKMGSPSFGEFVVERYNVIFKEIGGLADKMWEGFKSEGLNDDTAMQAVDAIIMLNAELEGLRNVSATAATMIADASLTSYDLFLIQREGVYGLIEAYDGTLTSTQELTAGLDAQRQSTLSLLVAIDQISNSITSMFSKTKEKIMTDTMTDEEKFNYYKGQADVLTASLGTMTDPQKIAETTAEINRLVGLTWGLQMAAGEEEAGIKKQEYLDYLDSVNGLAQARLEIAKQEAISEAALLADAVEEAILAGIVPMTEAAENIEESTDELSESAATIQTAVQNFGTNVNIFGGFVDAIDTSGGFGM